MNRPKFSLLAKLAGALASVALTTVPAAAARPNIIVLVTDDQRWDALGCAGNAIIRTPHLDALARDGARFPNAFTTTAICCVSRASILTGQYASRHGIHGFSTPLSPEALARTYPLLLGAAGYRVGFIGKYGVAWNARAPAPEAYDYWWATKGQPSYENVQPDGTVVHYSDLVAEHCAEFLDGCAPDKPFCLSVSYKAPHCQDGDPRQFVFAERYAELYRDAEIPPARAGSDADFLKLPPVLAREENEGRVRWHLRFAMPDQYQRMVKAYYRLITGVDDAVGRLRAELEKRGLAGNTIIVFLSDHGFFLGEHGLAGKWYGHEESIRIPLIIYDPRDGGRRGVLPTAIALQIDIAPTVLAAAGVPVPETMQGRSLWPLIDGEAPADWRDDFLYEHRFKHRGIPKSEGVAGGRYKYLRYYETEPVQEELYDLREDSGETHNLADDPARHDLLESLRARTDTLKRAAGG